MGEQKELFHLKEGKYWDDIEDLLVQRARRFGGFDMGEPHYHPYQELYYVISGRCRMFVQHDIYYVSAGEIVSLPPYCLHRSSYMQGQTVERFTACFRRGYIREFTKSCGAGSVSALLAQQKLTLTEKERGMAEALFVAMIRSSLQKDCYMKIEQQSLLFQLLVLLGRCQSSLRGMQPLGTGGGALQGMQRLGAGGGAPQQLGASDGAIQEAARYIYQHHRDPIRLEDAADAGHLSPTYFSKRFRQVTGMGFKEYLTHVRLMDGMELLRTTGMSVTEVALTCGFSDGNYFGDVFKRVQGVSPSQFRKNVSLPG